MDVIDALCRLSNDDTPRCFSGVLAWLCHRLQNAIAALDAEKTDDNNKFTLPQRIAFLVQLIEHGALEQPVLRRWLCAGGNEACEYSLCNVAGLPALTRLMPWLQDILTEQLATIKEDSTCTTTAVHVVKSRLDEYDMACLPPLLCLYRWARSPSQRTALVDAILHSTRSDDKKERTLTSLTEEEKQPALLVRHLVTFFFSYDLLSKEERNVPHWLRDLLPADVNQRLYEHCVKYLLSSHTSTHYVVGKASSSWCCPRTVPSATAECVSVTIILLLTAHVLERCEQVHAVTLWTDLIGEKLNAELLRGLDATFGTVSETDGKDKILAERQVTSYYTCQVWALLVYVVMTGRGVGPSYVRSVLEPPDAALVAPLQQQQLITTITSTTVQGCMENVEERSEYCDKEVEIYETAQQLDTNKIDQDTMPLFTPTLADVVQLYSSQQQSSLREHHTQRPSLNGRELKRCTMSTSTVLALSYPRAIVWQLECIWRLALCDLLERDVTGQQAIRREEVGHRIGALYDTACYHACQQFDSDGQCSDQRSAPVGVVKKEEEAAAGEEGEGHTASRWTLRLTRASTSSANGLKRPREADSEEKERQQQLSCIEPVWSTAEMPGTSAVQRPRTSLSLASTTNTTTEASRTIADVLTQAATSLMAVFAHLVPHIIHRLASQQREQENVGEHSATSHDDMREGHTKLNLSSGSNSNRSGVRLISLAVPAFVQHLQPIFAESIIKDRCEAIVLQTARHTIGKYTAYLVYRWLLECTLPLLLHDHITATTEVSNVEGDATANIAVQHSMVVVTRCVAALRTYLAALSTLRRYWPKLGQAYLHDAVVSDVLLPRLLEYCYSVRDDAMQSVLHEVKSALREFGVLRDDA